MFVKASSSDMLDCILNPSIERASILSMAKGARYSRDAHSEPVSLPTELELNLLDLGADDLSFMLSFHSPISSSCGNKLCLSGPSRANEVSHATCCIVFPVISSKGISFFASIESFSIPTDANCCSISFIPEPISAGTTTGLETCMIKLPPSLDFLKSEVLMDRKNPPFFVCKRGPSPSPRGGNSSGFSGGKSVGLSKPLEFLGGEH
uniref:Uncharacterized protein n=1 Tax=Rhizophora mucronata TaxID=61149 RepID=A0A2P2N1T3_RHIMU